MRPRFGQVPLIAAFLLTALVIAHFISFARYPIRCTASLSRRSVLVGDKITYAIRVMSKSTVAVNIPDLTDRLSQFSIIDSGVSREESIGRLRTTAWYIIAQYTPGDYTIGPVTVTCRAPDAQLTKLESEKVRVTVKSTLADNASAQSVMRVEGDLAGGMYGEERRALATRKAKESVIIKIIDIKGPINILTIIDIILLGAEVVLLVFIADWAIGFVRRRIRRARRVTPYEVVRKELDAIKTAAAKKTITPQECCARTSIMLKQYIKEALRMGSSEFTTADFLKAIRALSVASDDILKTVSDLLSLCDLVKFSGYDLSQGEVEANIESAGIIVESLHSREIEDKGPEKS